MRIRTLWRIWRLLGDPVNVPVRQPRGALTKDVNELKEIQRRKYSPSDLYNPQLCPFRACMSSSGPSNVRIRAIVRPSTWRPGNAICFLLAHSSSSLLSLPAHPSRDVCTYAGRHATKEMSSIHNIYLIRVFSYQERKKYQRSHGLSKVTLPNASWPNKLVGVGSGQSNVHCLYVECNARPERV